MTKEWYSAADLAGMPGMPGTPRGISKAALSKSWESRPRKARGGGREYHIASLPTETQAACLVNDSQSPDTLSGTPALLSGLNKSTPGTSIFEAAPASEVVSFSYDRDNLWAHYDRKSDKQKEAAKEKLMLLNAVMRLVENGTGMVDSFKAVGLAHGKSWRTIQGWYHGTSGRPGIKHYERTDWLAALVPGYIGRTATAELSEEAWEFFKADYLRLEAPAATACYYRLERASKEHGWTIPVLRTLERRLQHIPRTIRVLRREGEEGLRRLYPAQQRSVQDMHSLEWINGDGYQHNVFVKWPNGEIVRPKTWVWQDIYSRKILAYRVDLSENTDSIRLSFGDVVDNYGIPEHVTIDNTRAAANKWMTGGVANRYRFKVKEDDPLGLIPSLGAQVHWTSVFKGKGHGQAKPIERAFGVGGIGEVVDKHPAFEGAYTGRNTTAKPDNYGSKAVPIEKFLKILQEEITAWNAKPGRRTEICNGELSYDQAFNASYENAPIQKATEEQRRLWLLTAEAIPVRKDGTLTLDAGSAVSKGRNRYHAHELLDYASHKVVVRFDPEDLHGTVHVYTLDSRYICTAECIEATGFGNTEAARSFNRERQRFVKATKLAAKAETRMDAMEVADRLPQMEEAEIPESKVVRPLRPEPKLGRHYAPTPVDEAAHANLVAQFEVEKQAEVHSLGNDPRRVHAYWLRIQERIEQGQAVSEEEQQGWEIYRNGGEYRAQKELFEAFGLNATDFA
ncbi:MAG: transposase domain-containing protein [Candidatus Sedimenticola sp. (ex Thyasira tokunagai)]